MDYQPLFCDQMGPRGGPKSVPGSKWVPSWPETNPILSPRKLLQSKIVINSYQLVLDGPSICKQKNFQFLPPGGAVAKSWKSHIGHLTVGLNFFITFFWLLWSFYEHFQRYKKLKMGWGHFRGQISKFVFFSSWGPRWLWWPSWPCKILCIGPVWPRWSHLPLDQQLTYFRTLRLSIRDRFGVVESW